MSDLSLLHYYLSIHFVKNEEGIYMYQIKYLQNILEKYGMSKSKPVSTLVEMVLKLIVNNVT